MGSIRHHSIVVTSHNKALITAAHQNALGLMLHVSGLVTSSINGFYSFFVAPDGSKEGWPDSDLGDIKRKELTDYLDSLKYEDGSSSISYCEIFYGSEVPVRAGIVKHN